MILDLNTKPQFIQEFWNESEFPINSAKSKIKHSINLKIKLARKRLGGLERMLKMKTIFGFKIENQSRQKTVRGIKIKIDFQNDLPPKIEFQI